MNDTPTMPSPLDLSRLHSPAEVRIHAAKVAAYRDAVREEEAEQRRKQEAAEAAADRVLSEDEYFALSLKLHQAQKAKEAARQAAEQAEKDAAAAYLESHPETAEITADNPYHALVKLEHWIAKGYRVTEQSVGCWLPNFIHLVLAAPVSAKGGKQ